MQSEVRLDIVHVFYSKQHSLKAEEQDSSHGVDSMITLFSIVQLGK